MSAAPCNCNRGYGFFTVYLVWLFAYSCGVSSGERRCRTNPTHPRCVATAQVTK